MLRPLRTSLTDCSKFLGAPALRQFATAAEGQGPPRWYKDVSVVPNATEGEYLIQLDKRSLRTPARHLLAIPSLPLALAIAAEWQSQTGKIRPFTMPLMSLAATAIDEPKPREDVIDTLLRFVHTDALACRHDRESVAKRQTQLHDPVLSWASQHLKANFGASDSIFGAQQSDEAIAAVQHFLKGLSRWELAGVDSMSAACKSVLLSIALHQGEVGVHQAITLSRLEEEMQLEEWGYVEGGHDVDEADIKVRILSASLFLRFLGWPQRNPAST